EGQFVLDCSTALAWCFPDEKAKYPQAVLDSLDAAQAIVPTIWPLEIANTLLEGERRQRSTQVDTTAWLALLGALGIIIDDQTSGRAWTDTLTLARTHKLSSYDAAYLELAVRLHAPLATLDGKLKGATAKVGVALYAPAGRA
ncbi:MAG: type II toxin-antitoxin system VapC family toxin, partial [Pirellulales bacterium]